MGRVSYGGIPCNCVSILDMDEEEAFKLVRGWAEGELEPNRFLWDQRLSACLSTGWGTMGLWMPALGLISQ